MRPSAGSARTRFGVLIALLSPACHSPASTEPRAVPIAPAARPAPTPTETAQPATTSLALVDPAVATDAGSPSALALDGGLVQACSGARLDLRWIDQSQSCVTSKPKLPESASLVTRIEPNPIHIVSGSTANYQLVVANESDAPLEFDLNTSCTIGTLQSSILDAAGKRADVIEKCGYGTGCGGPRSRLKLDAKGDARLDLTVAANFRVENTGCKLGPAQPMAAGRYTLRVRMHDGLPEASAVLIVTKSR